MSNMTSVVATDGVLELLSVVRVRQGEDHRKPGLLEVGMARLQRLLTPVTQA